MTETITLTINHIVKTPTVLGGRPRIQGRRIAVDHVVRACIYEGISVSDFCEGFDITPSQAYAAISYYYDQANEIDLIIQEEDALFADMKPTFENQRIMLHKKLGNRVERLNSMMTVTEVSEEFGVSPQAIREACKEGWIEATKSGSTWLIRRLDAKKRWGEKHE